jgi:hypothetical protein
MVNPSYDEVSGAKEEKMKLVATVLMSAFILIVCSTYVMADEAKYNFRQAIWGMNVNQVKKTEKAQPEYDKKNGIRHTLGYLDKIAGLDCRVVYFFAFDKLVRTKYVIIEKHTNKTQYLLDYDALNNALTNKYGKALKDDVFWKNDLYKSNPQEWGMAVAVGHLTKFSKWEIRDTSIIEYLGGDNFNINFGVEYSSNELRSLEEKATAEENQSKL